MHQVYAPLHLRIIYTCIIHIYIITLKYYIIIVLFFVQNSVEVDGTKNG